MSHSLLLLFYTHPLAWKWTFRVDAWVWNSWVQDKGASSLLGMAECFLQVVILIHSSIATHECPMLSSPSTLDNVKLQSVCQDDGCEMAFQCFNLQFPVYKWDRVYFVYWPFAFPLFLELAVGLTVLVLDYLLLCVGVLYIFWIVILCQSVADLVSFLPLICNFKFVQLFINVWLSC
jgi:hypothetical protein